MRRCAIFLCGASDASSTSSAAAMALRTRDITLKVPCNKGTCRITFCSSRHLLQSVIQRHRLLDVTKAHTPFWQLVGTNLSFTNLLACQHDGEERVATRFTTNEATVAVESMALGECRAYLQPQYNQQLVKDGKPTFPLFVDRVLYNQPKPFSSMVSANLSLVKLVGPDMTKEDVMKEDGLPPEALDELGSPPHSLYLNMDAALLQGYFNYNMTLHGYHFLRQSDGVVPAIWLHTGVRRRALEKSGLMDPLDASKLSEMGELAVNASVPQPEGTTLNAEQSSAVDALQHALDQCIHTSFGLMITPLAAGAATERALWELQQRILNGAAASQVSEVEEEVAELTKAPTLHALLNSVDFHTYACQSVLSIVTGDMDKSRAVAEKARQCTQDPAVLAPKVEAIRRELKLDEISIPLELDVEETSRCALDFFCRCSPANFFNALRSLPEESYKGVYGQPFRCSQCNKTHVVSQKAWEELSAERERAGISSTSSS